MVNGPGPITLSSAIPPHAARRYSPPRYCSSHVVFLCCDIRVGYPIRITEDGQSPTAHWTTGTAR